MQHFNLSLIYYLFLNCLNVKNNYMRGKCKCGTLALRGKIKASPESNAPVPPG